MCGDGCNDCPFGVSFLSVLPSMKVVHLALYGHLLKRYYLSVKGANGPTRSAPAAGTTLHAWSKSFILTHAHVTDIDKHIHLVVALFLHVLLVKTIVTGFGKINHFVTFDTSNIYGQNNALYNTS